MLQLFPTKFEKSSVEHSVLFPTYQVWIVQSNGNRFCGTRLATLTCQVHFSFKWQNGSYLSVRVPCLNSLSYFFELCVRSSLSHMLYNLALASLRFATSDCSAICWPGSLLNDNSFAPFPVPTALIDWARLLSFIHAESCEDEDQNSSCLFAATTKRI